MITNSSSIRYSFRVRILGKYTNKNEYTNTKNDNRPSLQSIRGIPEKVPKTLFLWENVNFIQSCLVGFGFIRFYSFYNEED